jgi:hypothetical protein
MKHSFRNSILHQLPKEQSQDFKRSLSVLLGTTQDLEPTTHKAFDGKMSMVPLTQRTLPSIEK